MKILGFLLSAVYCQERYEVTHNIRFCTTHRQLYETLSELFEADDLGVAVWTITGRCNARPDHIQCQTITTEGLQQGADTYNSIDDVSDLYDDIYWELEMDVRYEQVLGSAKKTPAPSPISEPPSVVDLQALIGCPVVVNVGSSSSLAVALPDSFRLLSVDDDAVCELAGPGGMILQGVPASCIGPLNEKQRMIRWAIETNAATH